MNSKDHIEELLAKNDKAIQQTEEGLRGIREVYPRRYSLHSEKQDELIKYYKERCKLLSQLAKN